MKHQMVSWVRRFVLRLPACLVVLLWLASAAEAQPTFTIITLDNPNPQAGAFFGISVAGVGDVNGDNVPDILVGAEFQDVGGNADQGQAFVFSGADGSLLLTLNDPTPQAGARFGAEDAVAGVGDVNGDNVPDILIGANEQDVGGNVNQGHPLASPCQVAREIPCI